MRTDEPRFPDFAVRVYKVKPIRRVALIEFREGDLAIRYLQGPEGQHLAGIVRSGGSQQADRLAVLRDALANGHYVFTEHDPNDMFLRDSNVLPTEEVLAWVEACHSLSHKPPSGI
jgi:hypothetical protein